MENFSRHQQGIIKRYYENFDQIQVQKLSELVTELYLAEGKKQEKLWVKAGEMMARLKIPETRVANLLAKKDVTLMAALVKELVAS